MDQELIEKGVALILNGLGLKWGDDPNFKETPQRVARSFTEICRGLNKEAVKGVIKSFPTDYTGMVIVDPIKTVGLCPHHLLPIEYDIYIGVVLNGQALGLSKYARLAELLSAQPILQEDLTDLIADTLDQELNPTGVMVVVKGKHGCMRVRGVKQRESVTTTSRCIGNFLDNLSTRSEFMTMCKL